MSGSAFLKSNILFSSHGISFFLRADSLLSLYVLMRSRRPNFRRRNPGNRSGGCAFRSLFLLHPKSCMSWNPKISQMKTFCKSILPKVRDDDFLRFCRHFPALFHVKHSAACMVSFSFSFPPIIFRIPFSNKNPLAGSLHPAGDFFFHFKFTIFPSQLPGVSVPVMTAWISF